MRRINRVGDFVVGKIDITIAPRTHAHGGLLAWARVEVNGLLIDGVSIRLTQEGVLITTLPAKARGELGLRRPIIRVLDREHRQHLDDAVIDAFREAWQSKGKGGEA